MDILFETERLIVRSMVPDDAPFIFQLFNTPSWLQYIGDRNIKSLSDARNYLVTGPLKDYIDRGYGAWLVALKENNDPIGMCGLFRRPYLDQPDLGYALMPDYEGRGYALEMSSAALTHAFFQLGIPECLAIVKKKNTRSIRLLEKMGFDFKKMINPPGEDRTIMLFGAKPLPYAVDKFHLDQLIHSFFKVFTNTHNTLPEVAMIYRLCIPEAVVIKNSEAQPEVNNLDQFVEPRYQILTDGILTEFREEEVSEQTQIFGRVAHRFSVYHKSGVLQGKPFATTGMIAFQFIKTQHTWKISAIAWDDEKEGIAASGYFDNNPGPRF